MFENYFQLLLITANLLLCTHFFWFLCWNDFLCDCWSLTVFVFTSDVFKSWLQAPRGLSLLACRLQSGASIKNRLILWDPQTLIMSISVLTLYSVCREFPVTCSGTGVLPPWSPWFCLGRGDGLSRGVQLLFLQTYYSQKLEDFLGKDLFFT